MSFLQGVHDQARSRPDAEALVIRGEPITYAELVRFVDEGQRVLEQAGGDGPVALPATKSPRSIALILACLRQGRPALLVSPDLGARAFDQLVVRARCQHLLSAAGDGVILRPLEADRGPLDQTAFLLTTSGSTGAPKIVPLAPSAVDHFTAWAVDQCRLGPGVTVLNYAPLNFDLCLLDIWATLSAGGTVVLVEAEQALNPRHLLQTFAQSDLHVVQAVPMLFRLLAEAAGRTWSFPSVRQILLTGDHTPLKLRIQLPGLFPRAHFYNLYGCTETNDSFIHPFDAEEAVTREVLPIGKPLPGVHMAIEDGELQVSTPFQTRGYLDGPDDRFIERDGRAYFQTGDLVRREEAGDLILIGRNDFQVKVRGIRVGIEEIERVLLEHPEVAEAAVVALADPETGTRLQAVVRRNHEGLSSLRLREHCAARLARAAIPSAIDFAPLPLPRTSTGKIDRNQIRSAYECRK
jgi:acyl-coenzyme A synthetase/AMP-(fatty) acid ligase